MVRHFTSPSILRCLLIIGLISALPIFGARTIDYGSETKICLLRKEMRYQGIAAYIVTDDDEHQNQYFVHPRDKRRQWLTDFNGGEGAVAVVTLDKSALFVKKNYWKMAEKALSDDWILMKSGSPSTPSLEEWLVSELSPGDKVSTYSNIDYAQAAIWSEKLRNHNIMFVPVAMSLIDLIWKNSPPFPKDALRILPSSLAGKTSLEKLKEIRSDMKSLSTDLYVVTALDEIAWITNLRGSDYPQLPLFRAYMLIGKDFASLYISREKQSIEVEKTLNAALISLHDYDQFWHNLQTHSKKSKAILLPKAYSSTRGASYEVYITVPEDKIKWAISPALLRKDVKNAVERAFIKQIHLEDAMRHVKMMMNLENAATSLFNKTGNVTEFLRKIASTAMKEVNEKQRAASVVEGRGKSTSNYKLESFTLNYLPSNDTSTPASFLLTMTSNCRYHVTSTCMSRTFLPVNGIAPTQKQISVYTALLAGTINLAKSVFSTSTSAKASDFITRAPLYKMGLEFNEQVLQGFGLVMGSAEAFPETYSLNVFRTENIGYVEENEWSMRMNNVLAVIPANTTYKGSSELLSFDMATLLPFERRLIDPRRLTISQLWWLNRYHRIVRSRVGAELYRAKEFAAYEWLLKKTPLITRK